MKKLISFMILLALSISLFGCVKAPDIDSASPDLLVENNVQDPAPVIPEPQPEPQPEQTPEHPENQPQQTPDEQQEPLDKAPPCDVTIDEPFSDDQIVVALTLSESEKSKKYTAVDFASYGVINVFPFDYYPEEYFSEYKDRQVLVLMLEKSSKQAVLDCVKDLEQDERVYSAEPNFIYYSEEEPSVFYMEITKAEAALNKTYTEKDFSNVVSIQKFDIETSLFEDEMRKQLSYGVYNIYTIQVSKYENIKELAKNPMVERIYQPYDTNALDLKFIYLYLSPGHTQKEYTTDDFPKLSLKSVESASASNGAENQLKLTLNKQSYREYFSAYALLKEDDRFRSVGFEPTFPLVY